MATRFQGIPLPANATPEMVALAEALERWVLDREREPRALPTFTAAQLLTISPARWTNCAVWVSDAGTIAQSDGTTWNEISVAGLVPQTRTLTAGTGLTGGGDLSADRSFAITATGVTATTYGSATQIPQIAVNAQGHITSATNIALSGDEGAAALTAGVFAL